MKDQRGLDYKYPCELQADRHTQKVFIDLLTVERGLNDIEQLPLI